MKKICCFLISLFISVAATGILLPPAQADETVPLSQGQAIYVPAYSHIYAGNRELPVLLTVTLSIRNVDMRHTITITCVDYYGTKGELLRKYIAQPVTLKPLESTRHIVPQKDKSGGAGANFLVEWNSEKPVNPPLVESIMIGAEGQQGISFTSRGQVMATSN